MLLHVFFLFPAVIAQIFNPTAKLLIPIETPTSKAKAEIETSTGSRTKSKKMLKVI